jgi:hypothetical protein
MKATVPKRLFWFQASINGFYSSESAHDKRAVPRPKLFVSMRRVEKQKPQPQKPVLGSSPDEYDFYHCN